MRKFVAVFAIVALLGFASPALAWHWSSSDITVNNSNWASVTNTVNTTASSGNNTANGGSGGNGGTIVTGDAGALSIVTNDVNYNDTDIDVDCGCKGDITVDNHNGARVTNTVNTTASSGNNVANGGDGSHSHHHHGGSSGGDGGIIVTGDAGAIGDVANIVNSNITRIRR
ncbi:hypothetical protein EPN83_00350 [Patescibacteria group bacterium]|nr:MAG: hypothetical protein EPN83_00350 [Patescibacteria group bacterium]